MTVATGTELWHGWNQQYACDSLLLNGADCPIQSVIQFRNLSCGGLNKIKFLSPAKFTDSKIRTNTSGLQANIATKPIGLGNGL